MRLLSFIIMLPAFFDAEAQTPKAIALADSLFTAGTYKVAVTNYEFAPDIKILQDSIIARLQRNKRWAGTNLIVMIEKGDFWNLQYSDDYGITREEYDKMITAFRKRKQPVYSKESSIIIKKKNKVITFQANGQALLLNHLVIDAEKKVMSFGEKYLVEEYVSRYKDYAPSFSGFETHAGDKINTLYKGKIKDNVAGVVIGFNEGDGKPAIILGIVKKDKPGDLGKIEFLVLTIL